MSTPAPSPQSPVVTSTVRTLTPLVLGAIVYALSKANIKIDNTALDVVVNSAVSTVVAAGYTFAVRWLETFKSSKWGRLFLIAKAPAYAPGPAPQPAPSNVTIIPTLGLQPPTDGTAGLGELGIIFVAVIVAVALGIIAHAAGWL